ncbi:MAG: hypothetical protein JNN01_09750 [Opitutaceae bacterium]|nr:hypothetical protein [Opitutaceae bacterium]
MLWRLQVLPPLVRFGSALEEGVPVLDEAAHIRFEEEAIYHPPENTERRMELEAVHHYCLSIALLEAVIMRHLPKRSFEHAVLEVLRALELGHPHAKPLLQAEMARFPGHFSASAEQPGLYTGHRPLTGVRRRVLMRVNTPRQIEDPFSRSRDHSFKMDDSHIHSA